MTIQQLAKQIGERKNKGKVLMFKGDIGKFVPLHQEFIFSNNKWKVYKEDKKVKSLKELDKTKPLKELDKKEKN